MGSTNTSGEEDSISKKKKKKAKPVPKPQRIKGVSDQDGDFPNLSFFFFFLVAEDPSLIFFCRRLLWKRMDDSSSLRDATENRGGAIYVTSFARRF